MPHTVLQEFAKTVPCQDTSAILKRERAKASFDVEKLKNLIGGGEKWRTQKKQWAEWFDLPVYDKSNDVFLDRETFMRKAVERAVKSYDLMREHPEIISAHSPAHGGGKLSMSALSHNVSGIGSDHFGLFMVTILSQGTQEQIQEWVPKCMKMQILGAYGQTELGHGSNVRGLETTATFDQNTDEFVVNSPTLTSLKWWPGNLGVNSTHALVYARLIVKGKDYGYHSFIVQLRDENHKPLPGVVVGDIGPKMGFNYNDSGFCGFQNVRIPRFNMLAKYQKLTETGEYSKPPRSLSKIGYLTMTRTRVNIVTGSCYALAKGLTIAVRYNAVRVQGFKNTKTDDVSQAIASGENQILDYPIQQSRIFPQLATAYTFFFASQQLQQLLASFESRLKADPDSVGNELSELHATSAGLKAFTTDMALSGLEEIRKCCGGQGYAMSGGIGQLILDYIPNVTFEGDKIPMALQTARFLVREWTNIQEGKAGQIIPAVAYFTQTLPKLNNLRCPVQLASLLEEVVRRSVRRAVTALQALQKSGKTYDEAWSGSQVLLVRCAYNHCMLTALRAFSAAIQKQQDQTLKTALSRLASLFGLHIIQTGSPHDWAGVVSEDQVAEMHKHMSDLLIEIRPDAVTFVDAWDFDDASLYNSSIGRYDGDVYRALVDFVARSPTNEEDFQQGIFRDFLKKHLDGEYLKQRGQRAKL